MERTNVMSAERSPVVVAGMHRSGTSLVASVLSTLGVDMGSRLLPADAHNRRGYFEDEGFLSLNRRLLDAATLTGDEGHRDWGWTESERLDRGCLPQFIEPARALVAERAGAAGRWGWKDPRTTLLLDFWHGLLPEPAYVLVYRFPWEVADSMQRLGAEVFLRHPEYAYRIWTFYCRHLADFARRHRDRCLVVSSDALLDRPERFAELAEKRLGLAAPVANVREVVDRQLFRRLPPGDPLVALALATHDGCAELLAELDELADLPAAGLWSAAPVAARAAGVDGEARLAVVIPCFDHGEFLVEAVASVERSVEEPVELIIVDDGSRDPRTLATLDILRRAGYRVLDQENAGLATARNRGIEAARAPYVLPLDADNRLRPGFVGPALEILDADPEAGVVYGDRHDFGLRSGTVDVPPFDLDEILGANSIDACALVRKEAWRSCGGYDAAMPAPGWEDWDLWLGLAVRGWGFRHLPVAATDYRVRPGSMLSAFDEEEARLPVLRYLVAKHRELYRERLPGLVLSNQRAKTALFEEARRRERRDSEALEHESRTAALAAGLADSEARRRALCDERDTLVRERQALSEERDALRAERDRLDLELRSAARELESWRDRVAFMEGTRAWRWRRRVLAIRKLLRL